METTSKNSYTNLSKTKIDSVFLAVILLLLGLGLVQVYSSSFIFATETKNDGLFYLKRQALFAFIALVGMLIVATSKWKWVERLGWYSWWVATFLILLTFIPGLGQTAGGAGRWLSIGPLRFQPSEILKFGLPFVVARVFRLEKPEDPFYRRLAQICIVALPLPLLLIQKDFGYFAISGIVIFSLLFLFGLKWRYVLGAALLSLPIIYTQVWNVSYRRARVMAFLDPWADPAKSGFQMIQSLLSFHSGGFTGVGLGQGQGKLFFLPEAHTDFTLAVLGEEMGFIGFLFLMILYGFLIVRGFQISSRVKPDSVKIVSLGLILMFAVQVFINVGVALGMLPTKGLTLPFLSYGGSSLIMVGLLFGVLLNIEREFVRHSRDR